MTIIEPLGDMIVCVVKEASDQTQGGLYLPKSKSLLNQGSVIAKVFAVGPDVTTVKKDDEIVFHNSPQWLKHEVSEYDGSRTVKIEYTIISVKNVGGIVRETK